MRIGILLLLLFIAVVGLLLPMRQGVIISSPYIAEHGLHMLAIYFGSIAAFVLFNLISIPYKIRAITTFAVIMGLLSLFAMQIVVAAYVIIPLSFSLLTILFWRMGERKLLFRRYIKAQRNYINDSSLDQFNHALQALSRRGVSQLMWVNVCGYVISASDFFRLIVPFKQAFNGDILALSLLEQEFEQKSKKRGHTHLDVDSYHLVANMLKATSWHYQAHKDAHFKQKSSAGLDKDLETMFSGGSEPYAAAAAAAVAADSSKIQRQRHRQRQRSLAMQQLELKNSDIPWLGSTQQQRQAQEQAQTAAYSSDRDASADTSSPEDEEKTVSELAELVASAVAARQAQEQAQQARQEQQAQNAYARSADYEDDDDDEMESHEGSSAGVGVGASGNAGFGVGAGAGYGGDDRNALKRFTQMLWQINANNPHVQASQTPARGSRLVDFEIGIAKLNFAGVWRLQITKQNEALLWPIFSLIVVLCCLWGLLRVENIEFLIENQGGFTNAINLLEAYNLWSVLVIMVMGMGFVLLVTVLSHSMIDETLHAAAIKMQVVLIGLYVLVAFALLYFCQIGSQYFRVHQDLEQARGGLSELAQVEVFLSPKVMLGNLGGPSQLKTVRRFRGIGADTNRRWRLFYVPRDVLLPWDDKHVFQESKSIAWNYDNARLYQLFYTKNFHMVIYAKQVPFSFEDQKKLNSQDLPLRDSLRDAQHISPELLQELINKEANDPKEKPKPQVPVNLDPLRR